MKRGTALSLCLVAAIACGACKQSSQIPNGGSTANKMKTPDEAARKVLDSLSQLVTQTNYKAMGFDSLDEVRSARLGASVPRRVISYEQLLKYKSDTAMSQLFTNEDLVVYPIEVGGVVKSTASISKSAENWQISAVGDAYLAGLFALAGENRAAFQIVSIPGLNLDFAASQQGEEWSLIPARDYPEVKLAKGTAIKGSDALRVISEYAREFDKKYGEQIRNRKLVR